MKTFTAQSMAEAMLLVQRTFGNHSVILHTRSYKRGGVLGFGAKAVVEITAADGRELGKRYRKEAERSPRAQALASRPTARRPGALPSTREPAPPPAQASAGDLIRRTYAAARADLGAGAAQTISPQQPAAPSADGYTPSAPPQLALAPAIAAPAAAAPPVVRVVPPPAENYRVADELAAVRQLVTKMMRQQQGPVAQADRESGDESRTTNPDLPDPLVAQYLKLLEQEVAEELADEIVRKVGRSLQDEQAEDEYACRQAVHDEIARRLPTDDSAGKLKPTDDGRPRIIALVGPTGVGKTTTIAKLAATFKLKQGKQVGLVTMDTFRIAAVEQLRTYAGIIGLPLKVANNKAELRDAIKSFEAKGMDAILIDTAGRSQRAGDKLDELAEILEAVRPHESHLVLSSTANQKVLLETVERFSCIAVDRLIFTKLDEAVSCGVLLNVARRVGKRVSYTTNGQEVPHQIEAGSSDRLASLVMGDESGDR
ncbi:flagellar biosynthesis protein FlhF [Phycisphaeraceae bacterium D3-23]